MARTYTDTPEHRYVERAKEAQSGIDEVARQTAQSALRNIAPEYSETSTYTEGSLVIHNSVFYSANVDISTAEPWTEAHWTQTNVASIIGNVEATINAIRGV